MNKFFYFIVIFFILSSFYIFSILALKKLSIENNIIHIPKGSGTIKVVELLLYNENHLNKIIYSYYLKLFDNYIEGIKYGEFDFKKKSNFIKITNIITKPSNHYRELKIIGGWQEYQLEKILKKKFAKVNFISYSEILADTYKYQIYDEIDELIEFIKITKKNFFSNNKDSDLLTKFSEDEIIIIASLVEKEGKTDEDKKLISSVIFNRLSKNMKLQIDATTIFAITKGKYKLEKKLSFKDLKIKDNYNTYYIYGLPPSPICYVSAKTIEIVLENYKSKYLFYFYDGNKKQHIFSATFDEHKKLLRKYRNSE